jgi:alcohol dehydrogenase YqhD (iron-dependent ADH family)
MKYVYKANVNRFAQFSVRVWNVEPSFGPQEAAALEGIKKLGTFFRDIGMPGSLKDAEINRSQFDEIADIATFYGPIGNISKLNKKDVIEILNLAV